MGDAMNFMHVTLRWETPGAAPCRQKRGPRPHPTGRRGRLPTWKATPRRALVATLGSYKNMLTTVSVPVSEKRVLRIVEEVILLVVVAGRVSRARAMVRLGLMAMAILHKPKEPYAAPIAEGRGG